MSISSPEGGSSASQEVAKNKEIKAGDVLERVVFTQESDKKGKLHFKSSAKDRKTIVIDEEKSILPNPGEMYKVKIIEDTDPLNPNAGKFIGIIVPAGRAIPVAEWERVEQRVNEAEISRRMAAGASSDLYTETGLPSSELAKKTTDEIASRAKRPAVAKAALGRLRRSKIIAEELLAGEGSLEKALVEFRMKNLASAIREDKKISDERAEMLDEKIQVLKEMSDTPSGSELDALDDVEEKLKGADDERKDLLESSPEAFVGLHLNELKEYKKGLTEGRIIEMPYVKEHIEDIVAHLKANKPVLVYGHLGSGKTELAMHIAKKYLGKGGLVVSGSKHMSLAELYGHQILTIDKLDKDQIAEVTKQVEKLYDNWIEENKDKLAKAGPDEAENEKNRAHDRYLQTYLTQFKGGTISDFFLGPIYKAMEEGRPVIIDEVNAIPHEVLISLNHILTRRVGDKVNVQQDSGRTITIKEGFCVIMTGNLNQAQERYVDRQDMDPAFLSRIYKVEYDYLPQKTEGELADEQGPENELFQLLLTRAMDKNGNIEAPADSITELWNLAKAARIIQDIFAGREVDSKYYFRQGGSSGRGIKYFLKESVLSLRALDNIISQWQKEGYRKELDYYIWKEFISQSTQLADRAYLYQLLQDRFGFFQGAGWTRQPDYGSAGLVTAFKVDVPSNKAEERKFYGPRETVQFAFGKIPERKVWPEAYSTEGGAETEAAAEGSVVIEGKRVEYYIKPYADEGSIFMPGQTTKGPDNKMYEFLGVTKDTGDTVMVPLQK